MGNIFLLILLYFFSYKFPSLTSISESKKSIVKIEEDNDVNSDVKIQSLSS